MKLNVSLAIIIFLSGFASCSDEEPEVCTLYRVEEKGIYPAGTSGYTQVTEYEYSGSVLTDLSTYDGDTPNDIAKLSLKYDSKNRLIRCEDLEGEFVIDLTYDSEGKVIEFTQSAKGVIAERSSYEYNAAGQLVKVSYYSLRFTVMTLGLTVTCEYPNDKTNNFHTKKYFYKEDSVPYTIRTFEWDSKRSPYEDQPFFLALDKGDNNITKITSTYASTSTTDVQDYLYTYNSKGFPVKRIYKQNTPSEFTEEVTFEYSCKK
jgi:hypothetical protein